RRYARHRDGAALHASCGAFQRQGRHLHDDRRGTPTGGLGTGGVVRPALKIRHLRAPVHAPGRQYNRASNFEPAIPKELRMPAKKAPAKSSKPKKTATRSASRTAAKPAARKTGVRAGVDAPKPAKKSPATKSTVKPVAPLETSFVRRAPEP